MNDNGSTFDPAKYITKVSGRDYIEVKWRLVWLRSQEPNAIIRTEMVANEKNSAIFRAVVILPSGAEASGWGSETADDFGDYIEKAETKALGRALGALGFGTQFSYDHEAGIVDSPTVPRQSSGYPGETHYSNPNPSRPRDAAPGNQEATPRQIKYLHAVAREAGYTADTLLQFAQRVYPEIQELAELDRRGVSQLIKQLQVERAPAGVS